MDQKGFSAAGSLFSDSLLAELHYAARTGNLSAVLRLIHRGVSTEQTDQSGILTARHHAVLGGHGQLAKLLTILHNEEAVDLTSAFILACKKGHSDVVELLLERGYARADIGPDGYSGLGEAILENNLAIASSLLNSNVYWPERIDNKGLMLAAWSGNPALYDLLAQSTHLQPRCHPGLLDEQGRTALHWAALGGHPVMIEKLLTLGINPDQRNRTGNTALHIACMEGHNDLIQPMSAAMENTEAVNNDGLSVLLLAAMHGNTAVCRTILQLQLVDPNLQDATGNTALHRLAGAAETADINEFYACHANPDISNDRGENVLLRCIRLGNLEAAQSLMALDVDVCAATLDGQTALHLLSSHHMDVLVEPLVDAGARLNAQDGRGNTPLIQAVLDDSITTVMALTDELADIGLCNDEGSSAIKLARQLEHTEIERVLSEYLAEQQHNE